MARVYRALRCLGLVGGQAGDADSAGIKEDGQVSPHVDVSIERMLLDLAAAGWLKKLTHIWASPTGELYLGPAGAWKVMRGLSEGCEVTVRTITERP